MAVKELACGPYHRLDCWLFPHLLSFFSENPGGNPPDLPGNQCRDQNYNQYFDTCFLLESNYRRSFDDAKVVRKKCRAVACKKLHPIPLPGSGRSSMGGLFLTRISCFCNRMARAGPRNTVLETGSHTTFSSGLCTNTRDVEFFSSHEKKQNADSNLALQN